VLNHRLVIKSVITCRSRDYDDFWNSVDNASRVTVLAKSNVAWVAGRHGEACEYILQAGPILLSPAGRRVSPARWFRGYYRWDCHSN